MDLPSGAPHRKSSKFQMGQRSTMNVLENTTMTPHKQESKARLTMNRMNSVTRTRTSLNSGQYTSMRNRRDPQTLPHNRLPDIEPRIPIANTMAQRWLGPRGSSANRQQKFLESKKLLAQRTMEKYEKKFKAAAELQKAQKSSMKDRQADSQAKWEKWHETKALVREKQSKAFGNFMARSLSQYQSLLKETAKAIELRKTNEDLRSQSHQGQIYQTRMARQRQ